MNSLPKQSQGRVDNSYLDDFLDSSISDDAGDSDDDDSFACDEAEESKDNVEHVVNTTSHEKCKRSGMMGRIKGMVKQASVRSLFSNGSSMHEELESDYSYSENDDNKVPAQVKQDVAKRTIPKRPGLLKARSLSNIFNISSCDDEKDPEVEDTEEPPKRPGMRKTRSVRGFINISDNEEESDSPTRPGSSSFGINDKSCKQDFENDSDSDRSLSNREKISSDDVTLRSSGRRSTRSSLGDTGTNEVRNWSNKLKKDELGSRSLHSTPFSDKRKDHSTSQRTRKQKDELGSRSCHTPSLGGRKDSLGTGSSHSISRRTRDSSHHVSRSFSRNKSNAGLEAMVSSTLIVGSNHSRGVKRSEGSSGRRIRRHQLSRNASDPADLLAMRASSGSFSCDQSRRSSSKQDSSFARRPPRRSKSSSEEKMSVEDAGTENCEQTVASQFSDLSCSLGDLENVPEMDMIDSSKKGIVDGVSVPFTIAYTPDNISDCASCDVRLSECNCGPDSNLEKHSTSSMASTRPSHREKTGSSHRRKDDFDGVSLPGRAPPSGSFRLRKQGRHKDDGDNGNVFCIDRQQPLVKSKNKGSSEFIELNISCHDGQSVASLVSAGP